MACEREQSSHCGGGGIFHYTVESDGSVCMNYVLCFGFKKKKEQTLQKYLIYFDKVQKRSANLHICKPERFKYYSIISIFSVSQLYSVFISINNTSGNYAILYILYLKRGKCFFCEFHITHKLAPVFRSTLPFTLNLCFTAGSASELWQNITWI